MGDRNIHPSKTPPTTQSAPEKLKAVITYTLFSEKNGWFNRDCPPRPVPLGNQFINKHLCRRKYPIVIGCVRPIKEYACIYCNFKNGMKIVLKNHTNVYHKGKNVNVILKSNIQCYNCEMCSFQTYSQLVLMKHLYTSNHNMTTKKKTQLTESGRVIMIDNVKWLKCGYCPYQTTQTNQMKRHNLCHTETNISFHCAHCTYTSGHERLLKRHIARNHVGNDVKWFKCVRCPYKCKRYGSLKKHLNVCVPNKSSILMALLCKNK